MFPNILIKLFDTKNGDKMAFLYGSDEVTMMDFTLFPDVYQNNLDIKPGDVLLIRGRVERRLNKYQIVVQKVKKLS